jgi:hypothetical protein
MASMNERSCLSCHDSGLDGLFLQKSQAIYHLNADSMPSVSMGDLFAESNPKGV